MGTGLLGDEIIMMLFKCSEEMAGQICRDVAKSASAAPQATIIIKAAKLESSTQLW